MVPTKRHYIPKLQRCIGDVFSILDHSYSFRPLAEYVYIVFIAYLYIIINEVTHYPCFMQLLIATPSNNDVIIAHFVTYQVFYPGLLK